MVVEARRAEGGISRRAGPSPAHAPQNEESQACCLTFRFVEHRGIELLTRVNIFNMMLCWRTNGFVWLG